LLASAASIGIWLAMFRHGHGYSTSLYFYWDAAVTLAMFAVFVLLIDRLRLELQSSNERLLEVLEDLDAAVYVADPVQGKVLFGNRHFRETLEERPYESLGALAAKECSMLWPDGRRVLLRIVTH
jgi:PAS domain-containing protein